MPRAKGRFTKKAVAASDATKEAELNDAVEANGFKEVEVGDAISKSGTLVAKEEEAPVKAANGRGGRGKKADTKVVEEVPTIKAAAAVPKGRGKGKKVEEVEVIAKDVEENAQSNGVASASVDEEQQEEVATKVKAAAAGKGKRSAKAALTKENGEAKENGDAVAETDEKPEVVTKTAKGRGGKKAAKDTVEDSKEIEAAENSTKAQDLETKGPTKKTAGRKKKAIAEIAIEKEDSGKSTFDLLKAEDEENNEDTKAIISETRTTKATEPAESKGPAKRTGGRKKKADDKATTETANEKETLDILKEDDEAVEEKDTNPNEAMAEEVPELATKKTSGRKKKADDKASTELVLEKETNGKSLFDILKEETEAEKNKVKNADEDTLAEDTKIAPEPEAKPAPKKAVGGRKKKADDNTGTEIVAENETNGSTVTELSKEEDEEPPKKKGRGARKPAAVNKVEEASTKAEEATETPEVSKKPAKRGGAKVEADIPEVEKKTSKRGAKAQETAKEEDVELEKKPTKRGRGAVAKPATTVEVVAETVATEEAVPKKRSRKEPSVEKELQSEVEKPKKGGRAAAGKRKAEKVEDEVLEPTQKVEDDIKTNTPAEATEDVSTKKSEKAAAATTSRGGRKRAAPSTNKSKTDADEDTDKNTAVVAAAEDIAIEDDDDDVDDSKSSKAKKKKKEPTASAPLNATTTLYNKEDFQLAPLADGQTADEPRFNLKISSWNVAGLRAWVKKEGLKFLEYEEPDIFCLQETKCVVEQLPEEVARIPGYHPYWLCMPGGYAGVAIYSKIMPINVEYGIGHKEFDDVGRVITAEYEKFFLINAYVPNSGRKLVNLEARMKWEKLFQEFVQKFNDRKPVVICGDMNVSHQEIDLANPKTNTRTAGFTKEEREKMTDLLALGYVDTFRHLYPERKGAYTYWTYMSNARARNVGWRLDYFIVSERFTKRVIDNCIRSQCMGSDHCPITLYLKL